MLFQLNQNANRMTSSVKNRLLSFHAIIRCTDFYYTSSNLLFKTFPNTNYQSNCTYFCVQFIQIWQKSCGLTISRTRLKLFMHSTTIYIISFLKIPEAFSFDWHSCSFLVPLCKSVDWRNESKTVGACSYKLKMLLLFTNAFFRTRRRL